MTISVRPATREDARVIAEAVAMAIGSESAALYCGESYLDVLEEVASETGTQYSFENSLIASVGGVPAGAICGYDGALLSPLRDKTLSIIRKYNPGIRVIDDETEAGEFYLDSVGVLPEFRGQGIGHALLEAMTSKAHADGHEHVALIVDQDNPEAERLYARLGFRRVGVRMFFGHVMSHMLHRGVLPSAPCRTIL